MSVNRPPDNTPSLTSRKTRRYPSSGLHVTFFPLLRTRRHATGSSVHLTISFSPRFETEWGRTCSKRLQRSRCMFEMKNRPQIDLNVVLEIDPPPVPEPAQPSPSSPLTQLIPTPQLGWRPRVVTQISMISHRHSCPQLSANRWGKGRWTTRNQIHRPSINRPKFR